MRFDSNGTPDFWRLYRSLPADTREAARKAYRMWQADAFHPSLHFKKVGGEKWSIRVGIHVRAVGKFETNNFMWSWIGTHAEYDKVV